MKNYIFKLTIVLSFILTSLCIAQNSTDSTKNNNEGWESISEKALERASTNYLAALQRDNEGMVESAIINIMIMTLFFPERDYSKLITKLKALITEGSTKTIRYEAFIACNYLLHPERYTWIKKDSLSKTKKLFSLFREKLSKQISKISDNMTAVFNK